MKRPLLPVLIAAVLLAGTSEPRAQERQARAPSCEIKSPVAGETYPGHVNFQAGLRDLPARRLKARVDGLGKVHHFVVDPPPNSAGNRAPVVYVDDPYLPCRAGTHTLRFTVFAEGEPDHLLVDETVTFTVVKSKTVDAKRLDRQRRVGDESLGGMQRRFEWLKSRARNDEAAARQLRPVADGLHRARVHDLFDRLLGLSTVAMVYADGLDPDRALGCLMTASSIYDRELPTLGQHPLGGEAVWQTHYLLHSPPLFMTLMGDLYARYAHLDKALKWRKREIEFAKKLAEVSPDPNQRRGALHQLSRCHQRVADLYVLLADDMESWKEWHAKAEEWRRRAEAN
jgi:hypothetical protein